MGELSYKVRDIWMIIVYDICGVMVWYIGSDSIMYQDKWWYDYDSIFSARMIMS